MSGKRAKRERTAALTAEYEAAKPVVVQFLRGAVDKLRGEYARRLRVILRRDPEGVEALGAALTPCETCAFRKPADFTDGEDGFLQTACSLVHSLDKGGVFRCHLPKQPGDEDYRPRDVPCIGWMTLQSPIPGPALDVRELLGDDVVDLMVEGSKVFGADRHA